MRYFILIIIILTLYSCKDSIDGDCSSPFKLKVNPPEIKDSDKTYHVEVLNNQRWWLSEVSINNKSVDLVAEEKNQNLLDAPFVWDNEYFILEKVNENLIKITPKENLAQNKIKVTLQLGNCFGTFIIE
mgnify:FL=1